MSDRKFRMLGKMASSGGGLKGRRHVRFRWVIISGQTSTFPNMPNIIILTKTC